MDIMAFMEVMGTSNIAIVAAFFIGLMMAISPCPMATNITAIAYVSKKIGNGNHVLTTGIAYTIGRMIAYAGIASLIIYVGINVQSVSYALQSYGEKIIGPFLLFSGFVMLDVIRLNFNASNGISRRIKERLGEMGYLGGFGLGVVFALAFCPISAVLFFGMLIPLAIGVGDGLLIPSVFAFATGLPVILFSLILCTGISKLEVAMKKIGEFEKYMRYIVSAIFIIVGTYYMFVAWM